jgi:hypothetical protein
VTNMSTAGTQTGVCVLCGASTAQGFSPSSQIYHDPGGTPRQRPKVWLCPDGVREYQTNPNVLGWCGDCGKWGRSFDISPCGGMFLPE